jgi:hypothetical protein
MGASIASEAAPSVCERHAADAGVVAIALLLALQTAARGCGSPARVCLRAIGGSFVEESELADDLGAAGCALIWSISMCVCSA